MPLDFDLWVIAVSDYLSRNYGKTIWDFGVSEERVMDEYELDALHFIDTGEVIDFRDYAEQLVNGDKIATDPTIA